MAVTNADILGWLNANPGASPALINQTMAEAGVSASQYQSATGAPLPQVPQATTQTYFQANPDVAAAYQANTYGLTPEQFASFHYTNYGQAEGRSATPEVLAVAPATTAPVEKYEKGGKTYEVPTAVLDKITSQILAQGTTDKWSGAGYGSAQANAADMAKIIAATGATDISQFGQITKEIPTFDESGNETGTTTITKYGNKVTGQEVPNTYSERQTGNAFGGTFAGKGNTGYRVEFDAQGKPLFYTTGASSSDVPSWVKPALIIGAAMYGLDASGLLGGLGAGAGASAAGLTAAEAAALTAGDLAIGGGAYGAGAYGAGAAGAAGLGSLTAGFTPAQIAAAEAGLTGSGLLGGSLTAGLTAADIAALEAGLPTAGSLTSGLTAAQIAAAEAALPAAGLGAASLLGGAAGGATSVLPAAVTNAITNAGVGSVVNSVLGGGGTGTTNLSNLLSGGLGTAGNLLQMQQSREAALAAQQRIDAETAAAKQAAAFRPVGMTTRFGTSQFQVDPVTGQLTSAGYTLSPEAKAQQDRFMALSNAGLTQAEAAQAQFAPLQTGAQNLFNLGNQYIAQSPESVAQNYLNQQMALLQPGRQLELANLQNKLQQQGRGGLSVAQGGTLGATTPELQALYNARATQEAQLAAQAQQAGQQQVAFGAGLLGTGAQTMGQYYAGQQAAYAPYTTAMGQVQGLEALGQQPLTTGINLGQISSQAGANVGRLGLTGAQLSTNLATSADATRNLAAQGLIAAGNPNAQFGQSLGNLFGGLFGSAPVNALSSSAYGPGNAGFQNMLNDIYG